jgi:hypothetical protein
LDAVLTACRATSELVPELGLSLEPARRSRVALAALCVSAVATLGMYLGQGLSARADSAELELQMLARPEGELQRLTAEVAQAEAIRAEYAAQTQAIVGTARLGLPLEQLLAGAFGALQAGGGALESFEATPVDGVVEVRVQAQAPAGTREASWAMARSLSGLQATAGFSDLDLLPEERVPDRGEDESGSVTKFEIQGTWGGAR